jgi:ABC-type amino acid transport substrate-binding protein
MRAASGRAWTPISAAASPSRCSTIASKVRFQPLSSSTRFTALSSGEVDVLFRTSTHTMMRDVTLGLRAITPYFYDGHGFMVRANANISKASEMGGATICLISGTTNELVTADYFRTQNLTFTPILFERTDQAVAAVQAGRCDAFGTDASQLAASRSSMQTPADWTILAERFSKEPYGPYVRRGDDEWFDMVRWYVNALMEAEERGVTAANVGADAPREHQPRYAPPAGRLAGAGPGAEGGPGLGGQRGQGHGQLRRDLRPPHGPGAPRSAWRVVRTSCGPRAACSTRCRCAETAPGMACGRPHAPCPAP